ncbi:MAG: DUF2953 domain-containing protein [Methanomicrobiales archaeon]|nr:DUF2953 domain-containing protein [Methanomicrobiales archaeon]
MEIAALVLLFIFLGLLLILAGALLLVHLDITFHARHEGAHTLLDGTVTWHMVGLRGEWRDSAWNLVILILKRPVFAWPLRLPTPGEEGFSFHDFGEDLPHLLLAIVRGIKVIISETSVRSLSGDLTIGFSSPAATGILYGLYWVVKAQIPPERFAVRVTPDFSMAVLQGWVALSIRVRRPFLLIPPLIRLLSVAGASKSPLRARAQARDPALGAPGGDV